MEPETLHEVTDEVAASEATTQTITEVPHTGAHGAAHEPFHHDPVFWVAVAFIVFMLIAAKYVWPAIAKFLDNRSDAIQGQLEQAARLQDEAEMLLEEYKQKQQEMLAEAETILENAKRDAELIRSKAAEELKANLARRAAQAEESIQRAQVDAVAQLRARLVENATAQAHDVIQAQLKGEKEDPAFARALTAIASNIH